MSITVGSRLGAYQLLALIGEGGMGQVFRATDTRLKRDVAIKALPPDVAADQDRVARFRREAEALAALNHPHIAAIHDLIEADGSQFLVMELVEGDTIADRLQRGRLPIAEAVRAAVQLAQALEVAHARGIVHRDLKPANIKITPDGQIKVLDFGLAKDLDAEAAQAARLSLMNSPTVAAGGTAAGVILGTAAYMSPEQARGQRVDQQSDIWALGCVLFEMLTGVQPFTGHTVTDVLASVVRGEPDWAALPADTPVIVRSLLRRCLQKDPSRRLHHVGDARLELEEAFADPGGSIEAAPRGRPVSSRSMRVAVIALGLLAMGLVVALVAALRPLAAPPEMRVEINTPPSADPMYVAISPDARRLVFVAAADGVSRLWLRSLDGTTARPLSGTDQGVGPFWSPDSRSLGFFADGKLKRIDIDGELTRTLAGAPTGVGGAWNRGGVIVFAPNALSPLFRIPASGGEAVRLTTLEPGQSGHRSPQFLRDQVHFLFYATGGPRNRGLYIGTLDGSAPRRLTDSDSQGVLTASGHLLFLRQGTLFAHKLSDDLTLSGEALALADRVAFDGSSYVAAISASSAGPFAYRTGDARGQRQLVWFDRSGKRTSTVGTIDGADSFNPALSPDGRFVAINRTVDLDTDVWLIETARGVLRRFTFDPGTDQLPLWSPDGTHVIFSSSRKGPYDLYQKSMTGENETSLLETPQNKFAMGFSSDGRFLLYRVTAENTNWDLWVLPLDGDRKPRPVAQTPFQEMMGEFAPDGKSIVYQTNESGRFEIYVQSFPVPGAPVQVSTGGGSQPRWRPDGRELFYIALDGRMMAAPVTRDAEGRLQIDNPTPLFMTRSAGGAVPSPQRQQYVVSADGQRFLINTMTDEASTSPITLVLNWKPAK